MRSGAGSYPFDFYRSAVDADIEIEDWERALDYADALGTFFADEPIGHATFVVRRARAVGAAFRGEPTETELIALADQARRMSYVTAVPVLDCATSAGCQHLHGRGV